MDSAGHILWSTEAIAAIRATSLRILERVGVRVDSPAATQLLLAAGCTDMGQGRLRAPASVVEAALAACPAHYTLSARDRSLNLAMGPEPGPIYVHNSGEMPHVFDLTTGTTRPSSIRDQALAARVLHGLDRVQCINSLFWPADVPPALQPLYSYLALANETDKHIASPCVDFAWQTPVLAAMAEAVLGSTEADHVASVADTDPAPIYALDQSFSPVSPLQISGDVGDGLIEAARHGLVCEILPAPVAGTTAPASLAGALAQQDAEVLMGVVLVQAARGGAPCLYGARLVPADARTGNPMSGGPAGAAASVGATLLARRHGLACDCYGPQTDSRVLDMQAGYEDGLNAAVSSLARPRYMSGVGGMLSTATCLEALVVHDQIFANLAAAFRERPWDSEALDLEAVVDGVLGPGFLATKHTRRYLRREAPLPSLSYRGSGDEWAASGYKDVVDRAREQVADLLARPALGLPDDVQVELCRLIDDTAATLGLTEWPDPRVLLERISAPA